MATALKHKLSYHRRLFLLLLVFSWTLVGCFILFQYGRRQRPPDAQFLTAKSPRPGALLREGVRVTLIDLAGTRRFG